MSERHTTDVIDAPDRIHSYDIYGDEPRTTSSVVRYSQTRVKTRPPVNPVTAANAGHHVPQRASLARKMSRDTDEHIAHSAPSRPSQPHTTHSATLSRSSQNLSFNLRRMHWSFYAGIMLMVMLAGWVGISMVVTWWNDLLIDWRYGNPRTYQVDVQVGHGDENMPSHFIAQNLHGRILVIELAGGDPAKATIYTVASSLTGEDAAKVPVTLEFVDVNGDSKLDMIIVAGEMRIIYINDRVADKDTFRPLKPDEKVGVQ